MASHGGLVRQTVLFSGHVQGVGFRYTTASVARHHPAVAGTVRNLPDGRVELIAEGLPGDVQAFVAAVRDEMSSFIRDAQIDTSPATGEFSGFSIRH